MHIRRVQRADSRKAHSKATSPSWTFRKRISPNDCTFRAWTLNKAGRQTPPRIWFLQIGIQRYAGDCIRGLLANGAFLMLGGNIFTRSSHTDATRSRRRLVVGTADGCSRRNTNLVLRVLFGHEHLGYLYARLMGPEGTPESSSENHLLWTQLADIAGRDFQDIPSRTHHRLQATTYYLDCPILCARSVKKWATNFENLWTGAIYNKVIDYQLRFSLRFQLAGLREHKYFTARHLAANKMALDVEDNPKRRYTRKAWRYKVERSKDISGKEFRQAQGRSMDKSRYRHPMSFLFRHARSALENLSFQDRLAKPQVSPETAGTPALTTILDED